jgi:hypothetical protein
MYSKKIILSLTAAFLGASLPTSAWAMDPPLTPEQDQSRIAVRMLTGEYSIYPFWEEKESTEMIVGKASLTQEGNNITVSEFTLFENTPVSIMLEKMGDYRNERDISQVPIAIAALNKAYKAQQPEEKEF